MIPLGSRVGIEREARGLVRLQHLDARRGEQPEDGSDPDDAGAEQHEELAPADADEEEDGEQRGRVDERRAEVRLEEHEEDRNGAETDRP